MPALAQTPAVSRLSPNWLAYPRYWGTQIGGWAALHLLLAGHAMLLAPAVRAWPRHAAMVCFGTTLGVVVSHLLRAWLRRNGVICGSGARTIRFGAVGASAAGVLYGGGTWYFYVLVTGAEAREPGAALGASVACGILMCAGWVALFLGHCSDRRAQNGQTERARYETVLREAELRTLRGQLNPHFLFNALNVLRRLAATDPSRTRQAITQLAGLLRDSLNGSEQPTIKLAAELRQVDAYLQLEKLRFEERLDVVFSVDDAALARSIPPFAVLTLVENAVKHGISTRIAGGRIAIAAVLDGVETVVRVTNTGVLPVDPRSGRIGMSNLRERLRLLYGDDARLSLAASAPEEVTAELRLPAVPTK